MMNFLRRLEAFNAQFHKPAEEYQWPMGCTCKNPPDNNKKT